VKKVLYSCLLIVVLVSALFVGACSAKTVTNTATTTATSVQTTTATSVQTTTATATTVQTKTATATVAAPTTFTIGLGGHAQGSLDPCSGQESPDISANVFDTLMCFDKNHKLTSNILSSWNVLNGGKEIELKVKPGIKFSTGDPLTANDIAFSWARIEKINGYGASQVPLFDHTAVVDDQTIDFFFTGPAYDFIGLSQDIFWIVSQANYNKVGEAGYVQDPIGTGPYQFAGYKMNEYTDLVVNPNYYGPAPQIQKARFIIATDDSTRIAMMEAGECDLITNVPYTAVATLKTDGFTEATYQMPFQIGIQFDLMNPNTPFANLKVRQAIDYAIDKDALIQTVYAGIPQKAAWLYPWESGYDASLQPAYPYDLAKAKQLMSDAGYAKGFDWPFVYLSNVVGSKDCVDFIASELKQININLKPQAMVMDPSFMGLMNKWHTDSTQVGALLTESGVPGNPDPSIGMNTMLLGTNAFVTYDDPAIDKLILQIDASTDPTERATLTQQVYVLENNLLAYIPFIYEEWVGMMKPNVSYTPHAYSSKGTDNLIDMSVK
jgi:peptide/nickel transport system substrate-binding protein